MRSEEPWSLLAVARDPECVFVYWGARLPEGAVLRLLDEGGGVVRKVALAEGAGNAYLRVQADTGYRVQLVVEGGVVGEARVRTPPAGVSPAADSRWRMAPRDERAFRQAVPAVDPRVVLSSLARP